jgi:hypothetical protein
MFYSHIKRSGLNLTEEIKEQLQLMNLDLKIAVVKHTIMEQIIFGHIMVSRK